jgi:hypothetical protein
VLLLVPPADLKSHSELNNYLQDVGPRIIPIEVLGGAGVLGDKIIDQFKEIYTS